MEISVEEITRDRQDEDRYVERGFSAGLVRGDSVQQNHREEHFDRARPGRPRTL